VPILDDQIAQRAAIDLGNVHVPPGAFPALQELFNALIELAGVLRRCGQPTGRKRGGEHDAETSAQFTHGTHLERF
jgi:hypothetical protein